MPRLNQLLLCSCFLGILSSMAVTFYGMNNGFTVFNSTSLSAQVIATTVSDNTTDAKTLPISDAALTDADTPVSSLMDTHTFSLEAVERNLLSRTNIIRSQNNLNALLSSEVLVAHARTRSKEVLTDNTSHKAAGLEENIAEIENYQTRSETELADTIVSLWLENSTYRENLLAKKFAHVGIGVVAKNGKLVITMLFSQE